jgi:hypothetical protein
MNTALDYLGTGLASMYIGYAVFVLAIPAYLCIHLTLMLLLARRMTYRGPEERVLRTARRCYEAIYGLINPAFYLLFLEPVAPHEPSAWRALHVNAIAWTLLGLIWIVRLIGSGWIRTVRLARALHVLLYAALACLGAFALKDLTIFISGLPSWRSVASPWVVMWTLLAVAPLYVIPAMLIALHLRALSPGSSSEESDFLLLPRTVARRVVTTIAVVAAATVVIGSIRGSDLRARNLTLSHRDEIIRAAREFDVDPAVIAAIVYVTHHRQLPPFQAALERVMMGAWVQDATSHLFLAEALNISIGLTQIKPVTAQTAIRILEKSAKRLNLQHYKESREVPVLDASWDLPPSRVRFNPPFMTPAGKAEVAYALLDDATNLRAGAFILAVYEAQWEAIAPDARIRHRPDVLATLFQIGFERSRPHPGPLPNAFGRDVLDAYYAPWLQNAFSADRQAKN